MTANIGKTDRLVRFIVGGVIVLAGIVAHSWLGLIGLLPIVTASINFCPAYTLLGKSTVK
jgi:hypothetical protein